MNRTNNFKRTRVKHYTDRLGVASGSTWSEKLQIGEGEKDATSAVTLGPALESGI